MAFSRRIPRLLAELLFSVGVSPNEETESTHIHHGALGIGAARRRRLAMRRAMAFLGRKAENHGPKRRAIPDPSCKRGRLQLGA